MIVIKYIIIQKGNYNYMKNTFYFKNKIKLL